MPTPRTAAEALVEDTGFGGEAGAFLAQGELDSLANFGFFETIPPTVVSIMPSLDDGVLPSGTTTLEIEFSEPVVGGDVAGNFEFRSLGPDGLLGTADDDLVILTATSSGSTTTLDFAALPESVYRLVVKDSLTDPSGNALDGNEDGTAGISWVLDFATISDGLDMYPYRWATFDTSWGDYMMSNDPEMFGGVSPSVWTNGATAANINTDPDVLASLFTSKGYAGSSAMIYADHDASYSGLSSAGTVVASLFRIENTTDAAITWTPSFYYSSYSSGNERASVALNGSLIWTGGNGIGQTNVSVTLPPNQTSTLIVNSTRYYWTSSYNVRYCGTQLGFQNDSLDLPEGLTFVDDIESTSVYRWATFDTSWGAYMMDNDSEMFGNVSPSAWTNGATAANINTDPDVLASLFTNKGYAGSNAMIYADHDASYANLGSAGTVVAALFRIENTTDTAITWTPSFYYSSYSSGNERASVALNGSLIWTGGNGIGQTNVSVTLPPNQTSTLIVNSTRYYWTNSYNVRYCGTQLGFQNNSLDLPEGLTFADDIESTSVYRWATFDTSWGAYMMDNDSEMFGNVSPSAWTNGATAANINTDPDVLASLFTNKGYAGSNAMIYADHDASYANLGSAGTVVAALFRIENTTDTAITWTPSFYYSSYSSGNERASVALNGSLIWTGGNGIGQTNVSVTLPPNQTSTLIVNSTRYYWTSSYNVRYCGTQLGFQNNSLDLPEGLAFADDILRRETIQDLSSVNGLHV